MPVTDVHFLWGSSCKHHHKLLHVYGVGVRLKTLVSFSLGTLASPRAELPSAACREGKTKTPTHPTAATALIVSTQGPQEAVDHLDGTDKYLNRPYDQQDGEEGQMPGNHVVRLFALAP